ncbi:glycosyl hydrolase [Skermania sp. ID1734]|uniref:glycosyl hydrolase 2 galactose-binding domain-containing protein n=1 Tax=Skermania sp. ID1734 TaxID=2597516 RepID=UPI001181228D|nr:glycosyl hydrolase [Skermania sp. ID1734]TSE00390.1 glycosyl hydrolase [Skermania sp. ID1734]
MDLITDAQWYCCATAPDSVTKPGDLPARDDDAWFAATVPGTVAQSVGTDVDVDAFDWWFVTDVRRIGIGPWHLQCDGLATVAEIWLDDTLLASSESMFIPLNLEIDHLRAEFRISIRFRSMGELVATRHPRGRWRSGLLPNQAWRWFRTTLIGRAAFLSRLPAPAGPWRPMHLLDSGSPVVVSRNVKAELRGNTGTVRIEVAWRGLDPALDRVKYVVAGIETDAVLTVASSGEVIAKATVHVENPRLWWPHTHGNPDVYGIEAQIGAQKVDLGLCGFRELSIDRRDGRFALSVNGVEIFCRGACWVPVDPVGFGDTEELRRTLELVRDGGMNMVRVTGTMVYESPAFWQACAELGIMVWQDAMLATLDPPEDPSFLAAVESEMRALLMGISGNPALAVLSGGSETEQQPAYLGLGPFRISAIHETIPAAAADLAPDVPYVSSSPASQNESGFLPTYLRSEVSHYFGVGAYERPLTDVRTAGVRFATECLAFATPPSVDMVDRVFGGSYVAGHHPVWKAAAPRDRGASWDFEDTRDFYVRTVFGVDPAEVRRSDPDRYLDLGRAAIIEAMVSCYKYWRRTDSGCDGALVLALRDFEPGAGWGLLDSEGRPKAPWYPLSRVLQPVAVTVSDDGLNGIRVDMFNDTGSDVEAELIVELYAVGTDVPTIVRREVSLPPRSATTTTLDALLGRFVDVGHAYRFGPRGYEAVRVALVRDGVPVAEDVQLVSLYQPHREDIGLTATVRQSASGAWQMQVLAHRTARYVAIDVEGYEPSDDWFHLPAGAVKTVALRQRGDCKNVPSGTVRAQNSFAVPVGRA